MYKFYICQKSKNLIILKSFLIKYAKDTLTFVLILSLKTYKEYNLRFSSARNLKLISKIGEN